LKIKPIIKNPIRLVISFCVIYYVVLCALIIKDLVERQSYRTPDIFTLILAIFLPIVFIGFTYLINLLYIKQKSIYASFILYIYIVSNAITLFFILLSFYSKKITFFEIADKSLKFMMPTIFVAFLIYILIKWLQNRKIDDHSDTINTKDSN